MPESRFHIPLIVVLLIGGASLLLSSCGTGPEPPELSEIVRVEVTPDPVTTHYTAVFTLVVEDSIEQPYRVAWQLGQPNGSALDTLTDTQRFYWTAPSQPGEYTHSVRLETVEGEPLTEEYSFAVEVVPWNPPPADTTLKGKIVFSAQDSIGQSQIFTMNADGTNLQQLTNLERGSTQPSWSPDGQQIVFASGRNGSAHTPALWVMDADGGNPHLLHSYTGSSFPLLGSKPRWSPDGGKIVYDRYDGFQMDIYVYDMASGERKKITDHDADDTYPTWSPDGHRIIFRSDRDYDDFNHDLYLVNVDGSGLTRLTNRGYTHLPVWGPDGYSVVFRSIDSPPGLYRVDVSSQMVTKIKEDESENIQLLPYKWAPDGRRLLIGARERDSPWTFTLYILDTQDSQIEKIYSQTSDNANPAIVGADWFVPSEN